MNDKGSRMGKFAMVEAMLEREDLTATQDHVLRVLWMRFSGRLNEQGEAVCYPSMKKIAEAARVSEKTVERVLGVLEEKGLVSVPTRAGNRPMRTLSLGKRSDIESQTLRHCVPNAPTSGTKRSDTVSKRSDIESLPIRKNRVEPRREPSIEPACARETVGDYSRLICEVYPKHFGHSNTARQFIEAVDRIADQHESRERAAAWIVSQARAHWDHIASVCTEDPMTCSRVKVLHNWLDDSAYEQPNLKMRYAHLAEGALNRPYGASHAPDESRVNEIRERLRINRRASGGNAREAM